MNFIGDLASTNLGTSSSLITGDTMLAPLGNYGGPTQTMPLLPISLAIDAAVMLAGTPATDQRGYVRPSGAQPDIGAVEVRQGTLSFSNSSSLGGVEFLGRRSLDGMDFQLIPS